MTPAASSGGYSLNIQTIDAIQNVVFNMSVTGIVAGDDEVTIANKSLPQLNTQLLQYNFAYQGSPQFTSNSPYNTGQPIFSSQLASASWRITWSEHVLCFFSEANFLLTPTNNTTGSLIISNDQPILVTATEAQSDGPLAGLVLNDISGTPLSTSQIATLAKIASSKLISILNNRIVIITAIHEDSGYWQRSFFLRDAIPGIYYDGVRVKRPYSVSLFGTLIGDSTSIVWNYNRWTGELNYIPSQNLVNTFEPSAMGNEIKISYVAGWFNIPSAISQAVLRLMTYVLENNGGIKSLKTGTWAVTFKDTPLIDQLREELVTYILW